MPIYLLLSMQAAGMITDFLGTRNQSQLNEMGQKLQEAGINSSIEQVKLETEDASLNAMIQLRKNMGSQIAAFAARGTAPGAGSAFLSLNESVGNFNQDERTRRLNSTAKINQLRTGAAITKLNYMSENSKLWQSFGQRTFDRLPSSVEGWKKAGASLKEGFGLTKAG